MKVHYKMSISVIFLIVTFVTGYTIYSVHEKISDEKIRFKDKIKRTNLIIKNTLLENLWELDEKKVEKNLKLFLEDEEIIRITLKDKLQYIEVREKLDPSKVEYIKQSLNLKKDRYNLGKVEIFYSNLILKQKIENFTDDITKITIILIITLSLFNFFILKYFNLPIYRLISVLDSVKKGDFSKKFSVNTNDEYKVLETYFNRMISTIKQDMFTLKNKESELKKSRDKAEMYSRELKQLNEDLEKRIEERTKELEISKIHAEEASEAKSRFLKNISHEMRTPLTPIIGFSNALLNELPEEHSRKLRMISESGKKLLKLTNQLLDLSKIEDKKISVSYENFDIKNSALEVYEENLPEAELKKLNFNYIVKDDVPGLIFSDKMKIYEILNNFVQNAIKYTEKGFVFFEVGYTSGELTIDIFDSGIGIPPEKQNDIFNAFEQLDIKSPGVGLGLNIVKGYSDALNGRIELWSNKNSGTHFKFSVPILTREGWTEYKNILNGWLNGLKGVKKMLTIEAIIRLPKRIEKLDYFFNLHDIEMLEKINHEIKGVSGNFKLNEIFELSNKLSTHLKNGNPDLINLCIRDMKRVIEGINFRELFSNLLDLKKTNYSILLAEDTKENVELIKYILDFPNIELTSVKNGKLALEKLDEKRYNLVLLDIQMPVMDGVETLTSIRKCNKNYKDIPVIALTAQAIRGDLERYLEMGFDEYISKPIDETLFYSKIEEWLEENETLNS